MKEQDMVTVKTWKEFQDSGLLWWVNRVLHTFGWAIVLGWEADEDVDTTEPTAVYPARVKFRGFGEASEEKGFVKLSKYMVANSEELLKEAEEQRCLHF